MRESGKLSLMEVAVAVALALVAGLSLGRLLRRRRRRGSRRRADEELVGLTAAAAPLTPSAREEELDLEDGTLDPDELEGEPLYWDEGADDEVD